MKFTIFAAAMALTAATAGHAAVTTYTSSSAFAAAVSGAVTEDFEDSTLVSGLSFTSTVGSIGGGLFNDRPVKNEADTTFFFAGGTNAFGGIFNLDPGGRGQGLEFTLNLTGGGTEVAGRIQYEAPGFFGFTSTNSFDSVTWRGFDDINGSAETFNLDNAMFGSVSAAVPEPASWALMIVGFGIVGVGMRSRRQATIAA
ncbi:PEPxxWA-CTERM sorting domain-containing protein [Sandarakinorhabdus sp. DWP1-3-1]|uniref:PEPxxWA-CTERM sorting domain-containing protein n=1 Tax=Sandarakinorhabdus sp. DWP1-3-1 TaxID=2804627 RepID=UPI003CE7F650